jgi:RNA polymerase sigma factor (sigma-70 family)
MAATRADNVLRHLRQLAAGQDVKDRTDRDLLHAFCSAGDQAAFTALVRRHGPLVWGLCRQSLRQEQDAEDAFQATFLVLARKAATIRKGEALVSWLHGVTFRTVMSAKRSAARRREREGQAGARAPGNPSWDVAWQEVQALLDDEIQRLPETYRAPFLLCCLENRSREEAARLLGVKPGTVGSRLTRARQILQRRLRRRGVTLAAALAAVALSRRVTAAVPALRLEAAVQAALVSGAVSANADRLARGVIRTLALARLRAATGLLLAVTVAVAGAGILTRLAAGARPADPAAQAAGEARAPAPAPPLLARDNPTPPAEEGEEVVVTGRVLGPDGRPAEGARLYLDFDRKDLQDVEANLMPREDAREPALPVRATTGADGRFRFTFRRFEQEVAADEVLPRMVAAFADGYGFDVVPVPAAPCECTLRLTKPQPILGRVLDPEHNPVRGARVRVMQVGRYTAKGHPFLGEKTWLRPLPGPAEGVETGADGRFRLDGLGPDCLARLEITGPGIEYGWVYVSTRAGQPARPPEYGETFEHVARVGRTIRGTIRDRDSGKPVPGVRVDAWGFTTKHGFSDRDGRYELPGVAKSDHYFLVAGPVQGQPYFLHEVDFADERGVGPITADISLVRGLLLEGRVTDRETGKPLPGATVAYYPLSGNARALKAIGGRKSHSELANTLTRADGSYRIAVLPGPGVLAVRSGFLVNRYMPALVTPQELRDFFKGTEFKGDKLSVVRGVGDEFDLDQIAYHALVLLNPEENTEPGPRDVALEVGRAMKGTIVGPDGEPVAGATVEGLAYRLGAIETLAGADFTLKHVNPRRTAELVVSHKEKGLGAVALVRGDETKTVTVRLARCGSVAGRLVDRDGQPARGIVVRLLGMKDGVIDGTDGAGARAESDRDGNFRFDGVVPGRRHVLMSSGKTYYTVQSPLIVVEPGQTKDLGDLKPVGGH